MSSIRMCLRTKFVFLFEGKGGVTCGWGDFHLPKMSSDKLWYCQLPLFASSHAIASQQQGQTGNIKLIRFCIDR